MDFNEILRSGSLKGVLGLALLVSGCESKPDSNKPGESKQNTAKVETKAEVSYDWNSVNILPEQDDVLCDFVGINEDDPRAFKVYKFNFTDGAGSYGLVEAIGSDQKVKRGNGNMRIHYFLRTGTDEKGVPMGEWIPVYGQDPWRNKLEIELKKKVDDGKVILEPTHWKYKDSRNKVEVKEENE